MLLTLLLGVGLLAAGAAFGEEEARLKAAFIYNFTKYVTWPQDVEQAGGKLNVCIVGKNSYFDELSQLQGREVRAFVLEIRKLRISADLEGCHVAYLSGYRPAKLLPKIDRQPVLTISDEEEFVDTGGMIGLVRDGRRIRFDINLGRARDARLQISSRLLQLARRVE